MSEEKSEADRKLSEDGGYEAPAIEEVLSREGMEREVAYAGVPSGGITN